jgi:hypothetical protein
VLRLWSRGADGEIFLRLANRGGCEGSEGGGGTFYIGSCGGEAVDITAGRYIAVGRRAGGLQADFDDVERTADYDARGARNVAVRNVAQRPVSVQ